MPMLTVASLGQRFWSKVRSERSGCWTWTGSINPDGYGKFWFENSTRGAHRVAYRAMVGDIPPAHVVDHICFNRACVNPDHLRVVTVKQNGEHRLGVPLTSTTGARGVYFDPRAGKYRARAYHNGRKINGGSFATIAEAELAAATLRRSVFTHDDAFGDDDDDG